MNYLDLYNLENYLFDTVSSSYHKDRKLNAFNFFCIIIWKANRAKSRIASRLLKKHGNAGKDLDTIVEELTALIYGAKDHQERMRILYEDWKFRLPMASAILTVLYPDDFTVYDIRVCAVLKAYYKIQNKTQFNDVWAEYKSFVQAVRDANIVPANMHLRDKDRYLWAKSFADDLNNDIKNLFEKTEKEMD